MCIRDRDEVMNAVVDEYISETSEVVRHIVEQDTDFLKRMNQVVFTIIEFTQKTETVFAELKDSDRFMFHQSILEYAVERFRQQVAGLVEEGVEKGLICCKHPYTCLLYTSSATRPCNTAPRRSACRRAI